MLKRITLIISLAIILFSCNKDPEPYAIYHSNGLVLNGNDATVTNNTNVDLDFNINNNLNVDGNVKIVSGIDIGNDLNLNDGGKVTIDYATENDTFFIRGNMNVNDTLHVKDGIVFLDGNLNINGTGVLNVQDEASVIVALDLNNAGYVFGNRNITVNGSFQNNSGNSQEAPLNN